MLIVYCTHVDTVYTPVQAKYLFIMHECLLGLFCFLFWLLFARGYTNCLSTVRLCTCMIVRATGRQVILLQRSFVYYTHSIAQILNVNMWEHKLLSLKLEANFKYIIYKVYCTVFLPVCLKQT